MSNNNSDEQESATDEAVNPEEATVAHPWPYLKEMSSCVGFKNDSMRIICVLCKPKVTELLAYKNSPSNLKKTSR